MVPGYNCTESTNSLRLRAALGVSGLLCPLFTLSVQVSPARGHLQNCFLKKAWSTLKGLYDESEELRQIVHQKIGELLKKPSAPPALEISEAANN